MTGHHPLPNSSADFQRPLLNESVSISYIYSHHAAHNPDYSLFQYADDDGAVHSISYLQASVAIDQAATMVLDHHERLRSNFKAGHSPHGRPVIGILANADTISYATMTLGIMRCGFTSFPISTRNSAAAVCHLCRETGILQLFISSDPGMRRLAEDASGLLAANGIQIELLEMPQYDALYTDSAAVPLDEKRVLEPSFTDPIIILHSSGSTAFPKPIYNSMQQFLEWGMAPYYGEMEWSGRRLAMHALPMFHIMGVSSLAWACCTGAVIACFSPSQPPVSPTPENFLDSIDHTRSDFVFTVPTFIETWSRDPKNIPRLRRLKKILFGGAPMNKAIGDYLAGEGIKLTPGYGMTEIGFVTMLLPKSIARQDWEYFKLSPHTQPVFEHHEGNLYELSFVEHEKHHPCILDAEVEGSAAISTHDLLERHPEHSNLWRIFGRTDDQLMLSTGEKTNPIPLESIMHTDENITTAIMFGRGRFQNGVLIQPTHAFDPADEQQLANFRDLIWPTIERANKFAPAHSKIFKEMILVTKPSKPVEYTAKGTARRQATINMYAEEIDHLYESAKKVSQRDIPFPSDWSESSTLSYIQQVVSTVMNLPIKDDDDIFQQGCDSLQATWIKNTVLHAIRSTVENDSIVANFVYENPTILKLARFLSARITSDRILDSDGDLLREQKAAEMRSLVDKYSKSASMPMHMSTDRSFISPWSLWSRMSFIFPSVRSTFRRYARAPAGETILITGTTGHLGSFLLAQAIQDQRVRKVYAFNRCSSSSEKGTQDRQAEVFASLDIETSLLSASKIDYIFGDYTRPDLGLAKDKYDEVRDSITSLIHNAWRVDFNVALSSYEPLLSGVRNLLDLAAASPLPSGPQFVFVSSIATVQGLKLSAPILEGPLDNPMSAVGGGYGESKWVAEQVVLRANKEMGLRAVVARSGQLSGDLRSGVWNVKEWFPALASISSKIGALPIRDEDVAWLPMDNAASALLDFTRSAKKSSPVLHLVSPQPVHWSTVIVPLAKEMNLPTVHYTEWLDRVKQLAHETREHNSALNLLDFFETFNENGPNHASFVTDRAREASLTLERLEPIGEDTIRKYLAYWKRQGIV